MIQWFRDWLRRREQEQFNDAIVACSRSEMGNMEAELDKLPEHLHPVYYVRASANRLFDLVARGGPSILIENERQLLLRRVGDLPCYHSSAEGSPK